MLIYAPEFSSTLSLLPPVPPSPPELPTVITASSGATNLIVCWQSSPATTTPVTQYEVSLTGGRQGQTLTRRTSSIETCLNVTGLDPGSSYSISVVAIGAVDNVEGRSIAAPSFQATTTTTGELACTCTLYVHVLLLLFRCPFIRHPFWPM